MGRITTVEQLRNVVGHPPPGLSEKNIDQIDEYAQAFIANSPLLILSTSDKSGRMDASPKGDAPGFVVVEDSEHLLIPDRPGNKLAYGHLNVLENPRVGLLFMIPNTPETLRINGEAELIDDAEVMAQLAARGRPALLALRVAVEECFFHCGKAFIRSNLWQAEQWPERHRVPFGEMFAKRKALGEEGATAIDQAIEADYENNL